MKSHLNSKGNKRGMHNNRATGKDNFNYKHGLDGCPLHVTWCHIRYRCNDVNYKQYKDYGGKGVKLSDEFQEFKPFYDYMQELGWYKGCHISRKGDQGNYERGNIEIKTAEENREEALERRRVKVRNVTLGIEYDSVYHAAAFIKEQQGLTSKDKTIAENIRCKGLKGSISYGYEWEVV